MSSLNLDAEALYADLLSGVRGLMQPDSILVGIWSGGAWLAERLQRDLKRPGEHGVISSALVVGVPFHPDGAAHDNTERARRFARQLHGRFKLAVHEVDERYTTTEAQASGARDIDAESAAIILEQFLRNFR